MKLSDKVRNILQKALTDCECGCKDTVEDEDTLLRHYDEIIGFLKLDYLDKEKLREYYDLQQKLFDSIDRKYLYLLIEKVKNNLDEPEAKEVGELIKDKDIDFLRENINRILYEYSLDDLMKAKAEDECIRTKYLQDLLDKKHLMILLELLEES